MVWGGGNFSIFVANDFCRRVTNQKLKKKDYGTQFGKIQ